MLERAVGSMATTPRGVEVQARFHYFGLGIPWPLVNIIAIYHLRVRSSRLDVVPITTKMLLNRQRRRLLSFPAMLLNQVLVITSISCELWCSIVGLV